ncbi:isotocin receptor-like isoform X3 [Dreissena polymorpha]|uniref:isotocin receptor-like isoform X3 n=1 Tax=Dreissena polymorpha TaxID=45954 RepID=UPI002264FC67|nr:isotocin receptor-like isoform X3 [Dreissena polymorpha]
MESNRSNVNQSTIVQPDYSGTYVAISVVCLLIAAVIISLNGLVIFIIARQKDINRLHFFILHIAIAAIRLDHTAACVLHPIHSCLRLLCRHLGSVWNHWRKRGNLTEITEMNTTLNESTFPSRHKSMNEGLLPKARITTIKMTLIICLTFFICWLPATVFSTMDLYGINELDRRYYMVLQRLYPLNSACNPIIFLLFSKQLLPCGSLKSSKATRCCESIETTKTTL